MNKPTYIEKLREVVAGAIKATGKVYTHNHLGDVEASDDRKIRKAFSLEFNPQTITKLLDLIEEQHMVLQEIQNDVIISQQEILEEVMASYEEVMEGEG